MDSAAGIGSDHFVQSALVVEDTCRGIDVDHEAIHGGTDGEPEASGSCVSSGESHTILSSTSRGKDEVDTAGPAKGGVMCDGDVEGVNAHEYI